MLHGKAPPQGAGFRSTLAVRVGRSARPDQRATTEAFPVIALLASFQVVANITIYPLRRPSRLRDTEGPVRADPNSEQYRLRGIHETHERVVRGHQISLATSRAARTEPQLHPEECAR
jgi:hypothetical protein